MKSMLILQRISLGLTLALISCDRSKELSSDLNCNVSTNRASQCSDHPTLQSGRVVFRKNGQFSFFGDYEACFDKHRVKAHGRYSLDNYPDGMKFELLADQFYGANLNSDGIPRTIGTVDLELKTLNGVYTDLWAIVARGAVQSNDRQSILKISCQR